MTKHVDHLPGKSGGLFPEFLDRLANCFMVTWYLLPHLSGYKEDFTQPIIVIESIAVEAGYLSYCVPNEINRYMVGSTGPN